ncbi:MAG: histone deacetylase family protein [Sphingobacteriia bacterium]|nr:histone deacetylase family protein [Sphingobacteriia bacterium]
MKLLFNKIFLSHNVDSPYEGKYRLEEFSDLESTEADGEKYLKLVHSEDYINKIRNACENSLSIAEITLNPLSYRAACQAVGLSVKAALNGDFAVVRPPGHHAHRDKASGFCLFNNIAIATQVLVNEGKRVFILDIDGHHGDGTQSIFYANKQVFFCSIHQQNTYPFTGTFLEIGSGEGLGCTLNIPIPEKSGEKEFLKAVDKAIMAAQKFQPDVIGVSAGFDGYRKDRLLGLNLTLHAYYECGYKLSKSFKKVFAVLEGGYHADLKECVNMFVEGVNIGAKPTNIRWNQELSIG